MQFEVMSRQLARQYSYHTNIPKSIIISITDVESENNKFNRNSNIIAVCPVKFDDVEIGEKNCITKETAIKIIEFVNSYLNKVEKIVVHCEAGVSRSAGICAALMQIINGSDADIFDNPRFCPNMTCYRSIMENYYGSYNVEAADEKIKRNIAVWRKANGLD